MNITIVSPFYPPSIGGVEKIAQDTAVELSNRNHDVHVITTTCDNMWLKIAEVGESDHEGVRIHRLEPSILKMGYVTLMKGLRETVKGINPDIVHTHNLHPHIFQLIKWKPDLGYRVVAQLHYPTVTGIDSLPARALYRPTIWNLARRQEEVEAFIAHGPREREWLKGEDIDERRIVIARYPAVPSPLFGYQCKPLPEMDSIGEPIVLYLGRITWRKGVHVLIEAAESLRKETPDVRLVIAGPAEEGYLERIRRDVERRGLRDIVDFKGVLSEEEKYNYMGAATVFVSPSIKDIHPITLLEAQALGTPVISTDIAAIPDIVKDGSTGFLVEPENAEALKETIKKILDNPPLRETLSQEARTWASSFALENTVDTLENLYKNITESHR